VRRAAGAWPRTRPWEGHLGPTQRLPAADPDDARALARIKLRLQERLYLGNLDAKRDWGHAARMIRCADSGELANRKKGGQDVARRVGVRSSPRPSRRFGGEASLYQPFIVTGDLRPDRAGPLGPR